MKSRVSRGLLMAFAVVATACATGSYVDYDGTTHEWTRKHYLLDISTEPAGAAVTVNDEFVGRSPVKWLVPASIAKGQGIRVQALPTGGGQESQTAIISTAGRNWPNAIKVFLQLNLSHVNTKERIELDVRNAR